MSKHNAVKAPQGSPLYGVEVKTPNFCYGDGHYVDMVINGLCETCHKGIEVKGEAIIEDQIKDGQEEDNKE